MKKHKLLSISAVIMMLSAYGCSLDEFNPSGISTEQEWSTPAGYEKKVNDCYFDLVRIVYGQAEDTYLMVAEGGTDIWQDTNPDGTNGNWSKLLRYEDYGASNGMLNEGYAGFYGILSACNAAVHYADKVEGLSETRINELVSEARFIRAHALYNIVEQWGGKYLPLEPMNSPISVLPCSSVNDFYKVILEDLEFAMKNLPITQEVKGHVTRAARLSFICQSLPHFLHLYRRSGQYHRPDGQRKQNLFGKSKGGGRLPDSERRFVGSQAL